MGRGFVCGPAFSLGGQTIRGDEGNLKPFPKYAGQVGVKGFWQSLFQTYNPPHSLCWEEPQRSSRCGCAMPLSSSSEPCGCGRGCPSVILSHQRLIEEHIWAGGSQVSQLLMGLIPVPHLPFGQVFQRQNRMVLSVRCLISSLPTALLFVQCAGNAFVLCVPYKVSSHC